MIANLQFWYRYCSRISFCVVSLKLIYWIINGVPRDFDENAGALSVANLVENPLDLADFASIWRKIFAFGGQRIF